MLKRRRRCDSCRRQFLGEEAERTRMATDRVAAAVVRVGEGGRRRKREIRQMSRGRKERPIIDGFPLPLSLRDSLRFVAGMRRTRRTHAGGTTDTALVPPAR